MGVRRWVRIAAVTTLAVGATLAATAGPAAALPNRCDQLIDRIGYDWDQASEFAAWASIDRHDGNWQDYMENMQWFQYWSQVAGDDTGGRDRLAASDVTVASHRRRRPSAFQRSAWRCRSERRVAALA